MNIIKTVEYGRNLFKIVLQRRVLCNRVRRKKERAITWLWIIVGSV